MGDREDYRSEKDEAKEKWKRKGKEKLVESSSFVSFAPAPLTPLFSL